MKKTLLTLLGISALGSITTPAFSQENLSGPSPEYNFIQERVLKRIDKEMKFNKNFFIEYLIKCESSENNGEYVVSYYNFNSDERNKPDLVAFFRPGNKNAEIVMVDKDENGNYEFTYVANKGDTILKDKIYDIQNTDFRYLFKEETEKLKEEYLKTEEEKERKDFEERYKEFYKKNNTED